MEIQINYIKLEKREEVIRSEKLQKLLRECLYRKLHEQGEIIVKEKSELENEINGDLRGGKNERRKDQSGQLQLFK